MSDKSPIEILLHATPLEHRAAVQRAWHEHAMGDSSSPIVELALIHYSLAAAMAHNLKETVNTGEGLDACALKITDATQQLDALRGQAVQQIKAIDTATAAEVAKQCDKSVQKLEEIVKVFGDNKTSNDTSREALRQAAKAMETASVSAAKRIETVGAQAIEAVNVIASWVSLKVCLIGFCLFLLGGAMGWILCAKKTLGDVRETLTTINNALAPKSNR